MNPQKRVKTFEKLFLVSCAIIVLVATANFLVKKIGGNTNKTKEIEVTVTGNVKKQGKIKVPFGSTMFEILQVAGIKPTSDIDKIALNQEAKNGQTVSIGKRRRKIDINKTYKFDACQLDYSQGKLRITDKNGKKKKTIAGVFISEGDNIKSTKDGYAKLKWRDNSSLILSGSSHAVMNKIKSTSGEKIQNIVSLKSGKFWAHIQSQKNGNEYIFKTPHMTMTIKGTEFVVNVNPIESRVELYEGMIYIQNRGETKGINIIPGQMVSSRGKNNPLIPKEIPDNVEIYEYRRLNEESGDILKKHQAFTALLCVVPNMYILFKMDPEQKYISYIYIPSNTWVGDIASGCDIFNKTFLYGGADFSVSVAERLLKTKINKFVVYNANDVRKIIDIMGGISINVDRKAATVLGIVSGKRKANGYYAVKFMSPSISGENDAKRRQKEVLNDLFNNLKDKNILLSAGVINQIFSGSNSNITPKEALVLYSMFNEVKGWKMKSFTIPGNSVVREGSPYFKPNVKELSRIFN